MARVEQKGSETLVDIEKIKDILAANGVGVISGMDPTDRIPSEVADDTKTVTNNSVTINNQEVVSNNEFENTCRINASATIFSLCLAIFLANF